MLTMLTIKETVITFKMVIIIVAHILPNHNIKCSNKYILQDHHNKCSNKYIPQDHHNNCSNKYFSNQVKNLKLKMI